MASAARSIIGLFREINPGGSDILQPLVHRTTVWQPGGGMPPLQADSFPAPRSRLPAPARGAHVICVCSNRIRPLATPTHAALLQKRDRGRGADLAVAPSTYGAQAVSARVAGADLLEQALARGDASGSGSDWGGSSDDDDGSSSGEEDEGKEEGGSEEAGSELGSGDGQEGSEEEEEDDGSGSGEGEDATGGSGSDAEEAASGSGSEGEEGGADVAAVQQQQDKQEKQQKRAPQPGSLADLKRQLVAAKAAREGGGEAAGGEEVADPSVPIEMQRFLTEDDFRRIRWDAHSVDVGANGRLYAAIGERWACLYVLALHPPALPAAPLSGIDFCRSPAAHLPLIPLPGS